MTTEHHPPPVIKTRPKRAIIRLRGKLLLISLALLAIPWAGYEYVREMETFLRESKQTTLLDSARIVATVMHNRRELFEPRANIIYSIGDEKNLYARKLKRPIQLDGYTDDWADYLEHAKVYNQDNLLQGNSIYDASSFSYKHLLGSYGNYLYALFIVRDETVIYRSPNSLRLEQSDHLQIALQNRKGELQRYLLTTQGPGWVNAHLLTDDVDSYTPLRPEVRIKGEWQEVPGGYVLEIRIPQSMVHGKLAFALADVDDIQDRRIKFIIGTAGTKRIEDLGTILTPSPDIEKIVSGLDRGNSRIWVLNRNRHVLALAGSLTRQNSQYNIDTGEQTDKSLVGKVMSALYRFILKQPSENFTDELKGASRLDGEEIVSALSGVPALRWRRTPDERAVILSASHPVWDNGEVIGAVVVEQTSNDILTLQNAALENLLNVTLVVFLAATMFLLVFATRLSNRIRRLHSEAESAISPDGRIQGKVSASTAGDELGDLSRSFADMIGRLSEYTRYLESMASKLSHELRTPLAVVKSSLDNLDMQALPEGATIYTKRAREGIERLGGILNSMNEAARLEQALQSSEREDFRIDELVRGCVEGYRMAYPDFNFALDMQDCAVSINAMPERLAQMLDKLISNAQDFTLPGAPIIIGLACSDKEIQLSVSNTGEPLPESMQGRLFDSMVSLREGSQDGTHLGLGLYIVRLIAEFHSGRVSAQNRVDQTGVIFTVSLPRN